MKIFINELLKFITEKLKLLDSLTETLKLIEIYY